MTKSKNSYKKSNLDKTDPKNKISITQGPPLLYAFESQIQMNLSNKKDFVLFNTITNKGGDANGIFILIPWSDKLSDYIKITSIKIVSPKDKEIGFEGKPILLKKDDKTFVSARFPDVKALGSPFTDKDFLNTDRNKKRLQKHFESSTIWTSVKGIAIKKGNIDVVVKTIPYNNAKKISQPVTYNLNIK